MHFQLEGDFRTEAGGSLTYAVTSERLLAARSSPRRLVTLTSCQGRWQCGWWVTYLATGLEREGRMEAWRAMARVRADRADLLKF